MAKRSRGGTGVWPPAPSPADLGRTRSGPRVVCSTLSAQNRSVQSESLNVGCGCIAVSLRDYATGCMTSLVAYSEGWYVNAESRRHRLGSRLVQAAEAWARHQGLKEIASDTQIDNRVVP